MKGYPLRAVLSIGFLLLPLSLSAQEAELRREIQESQLRLEEIREERARLQREMETLQTRVRDVSSELRNIERQISASRTVLAEIDFQVEASTVRVEQTTSDLLRTRERLRERNAVLDRRLRDIYKRGPLHHTRVLLGADSFSDLLNRYRYLQMIATYDRALVINVERLEEELLAQNREIEASLSELNRLRQSKLGEVAELRQIESEHQRTLGNYRSREAEATSRLELLVQDERQMTGLIGELEELRREEEERRARAGRASPGPSAISDVDEGSLDWPVNGEVLYRFGREQRPNGTVLRWNGLGIGAPPGTPVQAVRGGTVVLAGPFEGYGPTVVLSHGDGFYTLYLYLEDIGVVEGRMVEAGQVVGTVGGSETPEGPHIEFQIRAPRDGGPPQALDPLEWLRPPEGD